MNIIEAIILGVVQGLTEFLPISSSGHIELGKVFLGIETKDNLLFSIVVHAATALSTIVIFRKDIWDILKGLLEFKKNEALTYTGNLLLSAVPVGLIGVFYEKEIESFFGGNISLVGFMLLITGLLLALTYYATSTEGKVTTAKSILIGIAQAIAILPGISRSGATIATALLLKVDKERAARFSFLMVLIPILGGTFLKILEYAKIPATDESMPAIVLIVGFVAAFISGLLACKWMINIVKRGKLIYFAIYCFIVGIIAIAMYV